jgi:hypothetical protein
MSPPVFGWLASSDGSVAGAFMHTPPFPVVLTDMTGAAAAELANPTSNTLYQRLGYRPVSDWTVIRFGTPPPGS